VRCAYVSNIVKADGTRYTFDYIATSEPGGHARLARVTSSRGYALLLEGDGDLVSKACVLNLALAPAPADGRCPAGAATASYSYVNVQGTRLASVTGPGNGTGTFTYAPETNGTTQMVAMRFVKPGATAPWLVNHFHSELDEAFASQEIVDRQEFVDGQAYTYSFGHGPPTDDRPGTIAGGQFQDVLGRITTISYDWPVAPGANHPGSTCPDLPCLPTMPIPEENTFVYQQTSGPVEIVDPLMRKTTLDYCDPFPLQHLPATEHNRCIVMSLQSFTDAEGARTELQYDANRNITQVTRHPKPNVLNADGSVPADIVTSAVYDLAHPKSSSKPLSMTDARGNMTRWTYAPEHGGVLTETGPEVNGIAPQTRYRYAQLTPRYWSGGALVDGTPVWLLVRTSSCKAGAPAASGEGCAPPTKW
jgi:hypothetical protein